MNGKRVKRIAMKGAFHGRTELPCLYSDSSRKAYAENLASWKHHENQLITIEPYSIDGLKKSLRRRRCQRLVYRSDVP